MWKINAYSVWNVWKRRQAPVQCPLFLLTPRGYISNRTTKGFNIEWYEAGTGKNEWHAKPAVTHTTPRWHVTYLFFFTDMAYVRVLGPTAQLVWAISIPLCFLTASVLYPLQLIQLFKFQISCLSLSFIFGLEKHSRLTCLPY